MKKTMIMVCLVLFSSVAFAICSVDSTCYNECMSEKGVSSIGYCRKKCEDCWGSDGRGATFYDIECYNSCIEDGESARECKNLCE